MASHPIEKNPASAGRRLALRGGRKTDRFNRLDEAVEAPPLRQDAKRLAWGARESLDDDDHGDLGANHGRAPSRFSDRMTSVEHDDVSTVTLGAFDDLGRPPRGLNGEPGPTEQEGHDPDEAQIGGSQKHTDRMQAFDSLSLHVAPPVPPPEHVEPTLLLPASTSDEGRDRRTPFVLLETTTTAERDRHESPELPDTLDATELLIRLGLDLHDGPLQDLAYLTGDVQLFRPQLLATLRGHEDCDRLLGRVDDLEMRLLALDRSLRELACSLSSPALLKRPFHEAMAAEVSRFEVETGIRPSLRLQGDFDSLTALQRITLIRVTQEALTNVRKHSNASEVRVGMTATNGHAHAEIVDDGCGFDVERGLVRAARSGRLGLIGMAERARLLGGSIDIESRPGGPTTVSLSLKGRGAY